MEKLKKCIFDEPQIVEHRKDPHFQESMYTAEPDAWSSFTLVVRDFIRNYKADNYSELVESWLSSTCQLGCKMSIKGHYLHCHLDHFPENLGDLKRETGWLIPQRFKNYVWTIRWRFGYPYDGRSLLVDSTWSSGTVHCKNSSKGCCCKIIE